MTGGAIPIHRYQEAAAERARLAEENRRLVDALAVATADNRMMRATATQANLCITELVAVVHSLAPNHDILTRLPFSQYLESGDAEDR